MAVLLGIDIGTTLIKVAAFDPTGHVLASVERPTPVERLGPEAAEHDAEALWCTVREALREVAGAVRPEDGPFTIGVSSFGEAGVLLGPDGRALAPAAAWYDKRPGALYRDWAERTDLAAARRTTGIEPDPTYGMFKLAWLARAQPQAVARATAWLPVADWVAYRLTGRVQTSASQAARTLAFDLRRRRWSPRLLASLALPEALLPPVRTAGEAVGSLTADAARATGLPPSTVVGDTGHDQVLAALAAGGGPDRIVNACGTAETMMAFVDAGALDDALAARGVAVGPHALPDTYYLMATLRASGSVMDWGVRTLVRGAAPTEPGRLDAQDYEAAIGAAAAVPPGANGVWFVPHLRAGAEAGELATLGAGHFGGLHETTTAADLLRAVFEGIVFESARTLASLRAVAGGGGDVQVVAVGGPTRNALWMQLKADVYGLPVRVVQHSEGALWGAALAGARGAGHAPEAAGSRVPAPPAAAGAPAVAGRVYRPSEHSRHLQELARAHARRVGRLAPLDLEDGGPDDGATADARAGDAAG